MAAPQTSAHHPVLDEDGLAPRPYENGVDVFEGLHQRHQRPQFRMEKTSIGPMTQRVLCGDDLSGEIYEWGWVDPLQPLSSSQTVAEVRCNLVRGDIFPDEDDDVHALDALYALAAAVDFHPWGYEILDDGLGEVEGFDDLPSGDNHGPA
jgi:hypothetical protein